MLGTALGVASTGTVKDNQDAPNKASITKNDSFRFILLIVFIFLLVERSDIN
jgi:hypothetical protein